MYEVFILEFYKSDWDKPEHCSSYTYAVGITQ